MIAIAAFLCFGALAHSNGQHTAQDAQDPALTDAAEAVQPLSGVRAGFWWADYDGDGLEDAFVVGADGAARLLRNSGDGSFADSTQLSGLDGVRAASFAAWQDFDRDGAPDLFVGTQSGTGHLMRNAGDGTFQDVTQFVGLDHSGRHLAAQWFDYDLDGLVDLAVRTDDGEHLYHALANGHFEAVDLRSVKPPSMAGLSSESNEMSAGLDADVSAPLESDKDNDKPAGRRTAARPPTGSAGTSGAGTRLTHAAPAPPPGNWLISACPPKISDSANGNCLQASSVPTLGMLYPLSIDLNVSGAGNVGIGTTTPMAKLDVVGTTRMSDTLTLNPAGDQALNVSTGSIYKLGTLFIHTKGGAANTAIGRAALSSVTTGSGNTASGYEALRSSTTGIDDTALGRRALVQNTTGSRNTAIGNRALYKNTSGSYNTANGASALRENTTGFKNTASGYAALFFNTTGYANTANGYAALQINTTGKRNTASGYAALYYNTTGNDNTASGHGALRYNSTGYNNTADGAGALYSNTTGSLNTASGTGALRTNTTGSRNTASGHNALRSNTTGTANSASGHEALLNNTTGVCNTAGGSGALLSNTSGGFNSASGYHALRNNTAGNSNTGNGAFALYANTTGIENAANGAAALYANTTGSRNTACGKDALRANTTGMANVASGNGALLVNTTGSRNTASGHQALRSNTTGGDNSASGYRALKFNTTGDANTASGLLALYSNTIGDHNSASGSAALFSNTSGYENTATGHKSLYANTTGKYNTAIGVGALQANSTGSQNTALGAAAGSNLTSGSNNIVIGNAGVAADAARIRIGTTGTHTRAFIAGIRGVTTLNANAIPVLIDSVGQLGTVSSSRRFKKDIVDMGAATENLLKLRPVRFRYKQEQVMPDGSDVPMEYGLIAEEVAEVFPDLVVYGDDGKPFTVKYHILSSMLLNEMEKMEQRFEAQSARLESLERRLVSIESRASSAATAGAIQRSER